MNTQTINNLAAGTYTVTVFDNNQCTNTEMVTLTEPNPVTANPTTDLQCDDGNGTATFNLLALETIITGGSGGSSINWFADMGATIPIINTSAYTTATTTVYIIVTEGNCTSLLIPISLIVDDAVVAFPTSETLCDEGNGTATFNLNSLDVVINGGNGNTVTWFEDTAGTCLLYTSPSPRDATLSRMPSSA